jgi:hypothetical protein
MAVTVKITGFWDEMPSSLKYSHQCFRKTCCLHLHGIRVSQVYKTWYGYRGRMTINQGSPKQTNGSKGNSVKNICPVTL